MFYSDQPPLYFQGDRARWAVRESSIREAVQTRLSQLQRERDEFQRQQQVSF